MRSEVQLVFAFEREIIKSIHPLAAGVEVADFAFEAPFADLHVPGAHARTLEARTKRHAVLIQTFGLVGDDGAAPIQLGDRAPRFAVADALFLMRGAVRARLQRLAPAQTGVDKRLLVVHVRPLGAPGDEGLHFLRAHYGP